MDIDTSKIKFPEKISVTEQDIDISTLTPLQQEKYLDLLKKIIGIYRSKNNPRLIIGFAGPTGSGKSVLVALFKQIANECSLSFRLETIGIDAFHYPNEYLNTHYVSGKPLKEFKGRYDTYDVDKLFSALEDFANGKEVSLPSYSRKTHDPMENFAKISEKDALLLIEGLWLLFDESGWEKIGQCLDYSFFIESDKDAVRESVIQRHMRGGRTHEDASRYYDEVDSKNFDLVMSTKGMANELIPSYLHI